MSTHDGENISHIGSRFAEERDRLGFSQSGLGAQIEADRKTLGNWESGQTSPPAKALSRFHELGADIFYIVTGSRFPLTQGENPSSHESPAGKLAAKIAVMDLDDEGADLLLLMAKKLEF